MARMPHPMGSRIGTRCSASGAASSSPRRCPAAYGPRPSSGWPDPSMTRPRSPSPTRTNGRSPLVKMGSPKRTPRRFLQRHGQHGRAPEADHLPGKDMPGRVAYFAALSQRAGRTIGFQKTAHHLRHPPPPQQARAGQPVRRSNADRHGSLMAIPGPARQQVKEPALDLLQLPLQADLGAAGSRFQPITDPFERRHPG